MLLAVVVTIVGFVPAVLAQSDQYHPYFLYYLASDEDNYRLATIMDNDGVTSVFRPNRNSLTISAIFETNDFLNFRDTKTLSHFTEKSVIPLFIVYDKNTAGFGNDFLIGLTDGDIGHMHISRLHSDNGAIALLCGDCIDGPLSGEVITSWDTEKTRWVSVVNMNPGTSFAVSSDLKNWEMKQFLPNVDPTVLSRAIEVFPIADDTDASKMTWIIIRKSNTDPPVLLYDIFVPDDANPKYKEMGVLDGSRDFYEFAVINSNSTDYRHRKVVAGKRIENRGFGEPNTVFLSFRELFFSGGKLRQLPISTVFPTPTYEQLFPSVSFHRGDSVLSCLPPSVALAIEAEMKPGLPDIGFGFDLFISELDETDIAVSFAIYPKSKVISIYTNYAIFAAGPVIPKNTFLSLKRNFEPVGIVIYKVLIVVDTCSVEYFVMDGLYVGSIFTFPKPDMNHHDVYASGPVDISNMRVRIFK